MLKAVMALALSTLLVGQAKAEDAVQPLNGIWTGTVGTLPVNVCLQDKGANEYNFGAYYYLSHLKLINLQTSDKDTEVRTRRYAFGQLGGQRQDAGCESAPAGQAFR